jgi:hypothetical protein
MTEPMLKCPKCNTEIKLTESLAAPLIEATRRDYEQRLTQRDADVAEKLKLERIKIAAEEEKKAKLALSGDLNQKSKEVADLQEILKLREAKLAEAQKAQAEVLKKERALDDAKRELELSVETRVREGLVAAKTQARKELEEQIKPQTLEKDQAITRMQKEIEAHKLRQVELLGKEEALRGREEAITREREAIDQQIVEKLKLERARIVAEEGKKAKLALGADLEQKTKEVVDLQEVMKERDIKLAEAQKAQAELLKKTRELEDAKRELDLTVEKRVQESLAATRAQAVQEAEEHLRLKVTEKEQTILAMQKQIEELRRKAEQGSQQLQGEVQELQLVALLHEKFPTDKIEPVPKGEHGGDVLHHVIGPLGKPCGTILWESKRTRGWSDAWLPKLRDDQRAAKANTAAIISQVLPKEVETFGLIEGVWVMHPRLTLAVAIALRQTCFDVASARLASEGQETKMGMVYEYMTGPRFSQRIQAIAEAFSSMKDDLEKERKVITKQWAKREEQLERVFQSTLGMYGDLQGIAGKTLQEIEGFELRTLESPSGDGEPVGKQEVK